jgi:hypothetical protein
MCIDLKLALTWLAILVLIFAYGYIEIAALEEIGISIRYYLLAGWFVLGAITLIVRVWQS